MTKSLYLNSKKAGCMAIYLLCVFIITFRYLTQPDFPEPGYLTFKKSEYIGISSKYIRNGIGKLHVLGLYECKVEYV